MAKTENIEIADIQFGQIIRVNNRLVHFHSAATDGETTKILYTEGLNDYPKNVDIGFCTTKSGAALESLIKNRVQV